MSEDEFTEAELSDEEDPFSDLGPDPKTYKQFEIEEYSYVYLILSDCGRVKIGITKDPEQRLDTLQGSSPRQLTLITAILVPNARDVEEELHERYSRYNTHGEWFDLPDSRIEDAVEQLGERCL